MSETAQTTTPLAARAHAAREQYWLYRLLDAIETIERHGTCRCDLSCLAPSEENRLRMFLGILQDYALGYQEDGEQDRLSHAFRRLLEERDK